MKPFFANEESLLPAIIQNANDRSILMLGYMNEEAFEKTLSTRMVHFYSRSRQKLWMKGETSGNTLDLLSWSSDCDKDALLFQVIPRGPTCHLLTKSCFVLPDDHKKDPDELTFLSKLEGIIDQRIATGGENSYVAKLVRSGAEKVAQKVGEEAVETVIAFLSQSERELKEESADLLFHLLVALRSKGVSISDIAGLLKTRHS